MAQQMAVFGKDDDGNVAGDTFYLLPDSPPPTTSQPGMPNVRLAWFGLNARDDSLTQFAVVIDTMQSGAYRDTVVNFTPANSGVFGKLSGFITCTLNPQPIVGSRNFYFKVIARDARGSMPSTINPSLVMYPY